MMLQRYANFAPLPFSVALQLYWLDYYFVLTFPWL